MIAKLFTVIFGLISGFIIISVFYPRTIIPQATTKSLPQNRPQVIGFLPYSLLSRAQSDYSNTITTLAYFGFTLDTDGTILKQNTPQEDNPAWYAFSSGKVVPFLKQAKQKNIALSLVLYDGDNT